MSRFHPAYLKEGTGSEDAVAVGGKEQAVKSGRVFRCGQVRKSGRGVAELDAVVLALGAKLGHDGGGGAEPDVQLLERIVVDEVELNVFVAPAFSGLGVGAAEQIQAGMRVTLVGGGLGSLGGLAGLSLLCRAHTDENQR